MQPSIVNDGITLRLKTLFESNIERLSPIWFEFEPGNANQGHNPSEGKPFAVYTDLQEQLIYTPSIEISERTTKTEIFSIGTQEDRFEYEIICTVDHNHPENSKKYLQVFSKAIMDLLNEFGNRSYVIPGYDFKAYFSEATDIDYGFRRGKGLKSSRINWYTKILKGNRF